jgi:hypothetical protein
MDALSRNLTGEINTIKVRVISTALVKAGGEMYAIATTERESTSNPT